MKPRASFAGAAIEVSDLKRSVAFHRLWLPTLGFHRVWTSPDRVLWARGYDHFVMRQAADGVTHGPGALWLAVSAESRAQVDQIHADLREAGAEILQPPKELDYFAPGYYSVGFRDPDGVPIEVVHRWDELLGGLCRAGFVIEDTFEPKHGDASAAPGSFGHRCWFIAPYLAIKARRKATAPPERKLLVG